MAHADILIHPAVSEGFCNAVLEAQAMGLPVVVTDADGLPENVVHEETGFIVPRRDPNAMANAVQRLWESPKLRVRMGRKGVERVRQVFNLDDQIQAFLELYQEVLTVPSP